MPARHLRSRSSKRTPTKLPGGKTKMRYRPRRPGYARCALCGQQLHGIAPWIRRAPRSSKRPSRIYGGKICSSCVRIRIMQQVWSAAGDST